MLYFVWLWLPNLYHLHISDQFRNSFLFQSFCSNHDLCILRARYFHTVLQSRSYLTIFNKIATQGAPQMSVDIKTRTLTAYRELFTLYPTRCYSHYQQSRRTERTQRSRIHTTCRKLFYTICHGPELTLSIEKLHSPSYHRRLAWTRLKFIKITIVAACICIKVTPHFRTSSDWYVNKGKQPYFVCDLSRVSSVAYRQNWLHSGSIRKVDRWYSRS